MNGLVLHCGANAAEIEAVHAIPTPEATASWQPICAKMLGKSAEDVAGRAA
jgi:hypothetical protein